VGFIAKFEIDPPILRDAFESAPETVLELEDVHRCDAGTRLVFWAEGSSFDAFEDGLSGDPTVERFDVLMELAECHAYRLTLSERGERHVTYPFAIRHGITFLNITVARGTAQIRVLVLNREQLTTYREQFRARDVPFRLVSIYSSEECFQARYGVTEPQYEALRHAFAAGFFEIPRQTTLERMAADLDISRQALSERLRRGHANLLGHTLAPTPD